MDFWEIYNQYYAKVRRFILTFVKDEWVADDLIQETFVRIQENLDTIKDPSRISSWYDIMDFSFGISPKSRKDRSADLPSDQQPLQIFQNLSQSCPFSEYPRDPSLLTRHTLTAPLSSPLQRIIQ